MIQRRTLIGAAAGVLAAPAIIERVGAQSAFDWKQAKGAKIEVNLAKSPRGDVLQAKQKEFEELTGIRVGSEQIPEQQQRPKVALEMASGRPSFDVVTVAMHVQKKLVEKGQWLEDLRPYIADPTKTAADFDMPDFSAAGMHAATGSDGRLNAFPLNQDLFILFWNKALFAAKGLGLPKTMDELYETAKALTDRSKGTFGFTGRGLKNANVVLWSNILLGQDQETITADGHTLLTDTPAAVWAGEYYGRLMRDCAPPGSVGYNWNECQTTFSQGRAAMWWDGVGFSAPLVDRTKSKVVEQMSFAAVPRGPKAQHSATFVDAIGLPTTTRNKLAAYLYCQWATSKPILTEVLRTGSGTPPRTSVYANADVVKASPFPADWFEAVGQSLKIARSGLPEIVPVTEFRDTIGVALTNIIGGADVASELKKATEAFKPTLAKDA